MVKSILWTTSRARLQLVHKSGEEDVNWLFLPGGPGLGSESLLPLVDILKLPGSLWLLDLPGDGSNTTLDNYESFSKWPIALLEAVSQFNHVILVAHSTGGMYALSLPELESHLDGFVLLNSAPDAGWQTSFAEVVRNFPVPGLEVLQEQYKKNPNNQTLKAVTKASAPYLFTQKGQTSGIELLSSLPYNYETYQWSEQYFDRTYQVKWIPETIPTFILAGEKDLVTPPKLFKDDQRFNRKNIIFEEIKDAGHFPWIENPTDVVAAMNSHTNRLKK